MTLEVSHSRDRADRPAGGPAYSKAVAELREILAELDRLLEPDGFADYCPNGLQVEGRSEVRTVATGVSATLALFERAIDHRADLVLTHHGIFWDGDDPRVVGRLQERLRILLTHGVGLAAYHLPLDGHPRVGNNALIAERLGCVERLPFGVHRGRAIGCRARFPGEGIPTAELLSRVTELTQRTPVAFPCGPDPIRTIGIVSGAGSGHLDEALAAGLDAFLTGEPAERVMAQAEESGIHFIAAGHYATETFGVRALGAHLVDRFAVEHVFVDLPNPI
jgi:dinuclear metal center YbgI/SA1388 family protein